MEKMQQSKAKSWGVLVILSLFFGGFGVDRFYMGKAGTGFLKLITFGGLGLWSLIDFITILFNQMTDINGNKPLK